MFGSVVHSEPTTVPTGALASRPSVDRPTSVGGVSLGQTEIDSTCSCSPLSELPARTRSLIVSGEVLTNGSTVCSTSPSSQNNVLSGSGARENSTGTPLEGNCASSRPTTV